MRTILSRNAPHSGGDLVERYVPGDLLPTGIGVTLRTTAPQRARQSVLAINQLRRSPAFGADSGAGRVFRIRVQPREAPAFDRRDGAAAGNAEAAEASHSAHILGLGSHALPSGLLPKYTARV